MRWLDGKKTVLGGALLLAGAINDQVLQGIWDWHSPIVSNVAQTCEWFGMAVTSWGLGHKTAKRVKAWREGPEAASGP